MQLTGGSVAYIQSTAGAIPTIVLAGTGTWSVAATFAAAGSSAVGFGVNININAPGQTVTIANTNNSNNLYNYYSLQNSTEVVAEPATSDWDLKFTKYYTALPPNNTMYLVTGVLHNDMVEIAENDEPNGIPENPTLTYSTDINTIGYDWKSFTGGSFSVDSQKSLYARHLI